MYRYTNITKEKDKPYFIRYPTIQSPGPPCPSEALPPLAPPGAPPPPPSAMPYFASPMLRLPPFHAYYRPPPMPYHARACIDSHAKGSAIVSDTYGVCCA